MNNLINTTIAFLLSILTVFTGYYSIMLVAIFVNIMILYHVTQIYTLLKNGSNNKR